MKLTFDKFIFFFKTSLLSCIGIFLFLSIITYSSEDLSFNVTTGAPVQNLCGVFGSHIADILVQLFGVSSFMIVLLVLLPILFDRNIYLYLINGCSILIGTSGIVSRVPFKLMDRYYYGGVLSIPFQKFPVSVLCCMLMLGFVGIIGWKKVIMYFYNAIIAVYYKITCKSSSHCAPAAAIFHLQDSYNVEEHTEVINQRFNAGRFGK